LTRTRDVGQVKSIVDPNILKTNICPEYNEEKARQLLAEAGYPDGFSINLLVKQDDVWLATMIQAYLSEIGVNATIEVVTDSVYYTRLYSRDFQMIIVPTYVDWNDTAALLGRLFLSNSNENITGFSDPQFDQLYNTGEFDAAEGLAFPDLGPSVLPLLWNMAPILVTTNEPSDITDTSATLNGYLASLGEYTTVLNGMYNENVDVHKSITVQAVSSANVTAASPDDYVVYVTADYVNISGFSIEGLGDTITKGGIFLGVDTDNCMVLSNTVSNSYLGIYLYSSDNNIITNNTVRDNYCGIRLIESDNNRLGNNVIQDNGHGIMLENSHDNKVLGNDIFDNIEPAGSGILLDDTSSGNIIHFNNIVGNLPYGIYNENTSENVSAKNN
jgi:parallel beta-helix repeat protein